MREARLDTSRPRQSLFFGVSASSLCAPPPPGPWAQTGSLRASPSLSRSGRPWRQPSVRSGCTCDGGTLAVSPQELAVWWERWAGQAEHRRRRAGGVVGGEAATAVPVPPRTPCGLQTAGTSGGLPRAPGVCGAACAVHAALSRGFSSRALRHLPRPSQGAVAVLQRGRPRGGERRYVPPPPRLAAPCSVVCAAGPGEEEALTEVALAAELQKASQKRCSVFFF